MSLLQRPPLSLYIHIPWCIKKCPYCDFNSHEREQALPEAGYLQALLGDLDREIARHATGPGLHSIFIGGGTPSLLSAGFYDELLQGIGKRLRLPDNIEITLEANPGTVDSANFAGFRSAGINRLSIGVQSFNNRQLQALGRVHDAGQAVDALHKARAAGFDNINLDLMHGLPGQSAQDAQDDLQRALALEPEHLSWYQLTIERNTAFYSNPPRLPPENVLATIQQKGIELLQGAGFAQYEVSAFARPGRQSTHNLNYWMFGDYMGIGAGAHGKSSGHEGIARRWKTRMPDDYIRAVDPLAGERHLDANEVPVEFMMNALRLKNGFAEEIYQQRTGQALTVIGPTIEALVERGLLERNQGRIAASATGWRFLNDVVAQFLPA